MITDARADFAADYKLLVEDEPELTWIESDPYKELPGILSSIEKSGGHANFHQLKREDLKALKAAIASGMVHRSVRPARLTNLRPR